MTKKITVALLALLGLIFLGFAVYYFITPANHLAHFMPGYAPDVSKTHFKHGLGAFILALGSWILAWFHSANRKKDTTPAATQ